MEIHPIEKLWINSQKIDSPDGAQFSRGEINGIVGAAVSRGEAAVVERIIENLTTVSANADLHAFDSAADFAKAGRRNVAASGANTEIGDLLRMGQEMQGLEDNRNAAFNDSERKAYLLSTATQIRHEVEIARRIPTIVENLSYGAFDWKVFDSEAKAALEQIEAAGDYANVVIRHLAVKDGGKFLRRLVDQLPSDGKRSLRAVVNGLDSETHSTMERTIGRDLWNQLQRA